MDSHTTATSETHRRKARRNPAGPATLVRAGLQMLYKARFWRVRRVAEEDERDEILGHTRRYITLFAIFTPLVIIMLVLSPMTREETTNEENIQSHFPAQSH